MVKLCTIDMIVMRNIYNMNWITSHETFFDLCSIKSQNDVREQILIRIYISFNLMAMCTYL